MEQSPISSLSSTGTVTSRFVSQNDIDSARQRREEQWKAAYARLGQAPPPPPVEDSYDGRSLAEKLAANKIAKQEEWEEKTKLANQFRALEEDEIMFLDSVREKQQEEERQRKQRDGEEVKTFKEAVAARASTVNNPLSITRPSDSIPTKTKVATVPKKDAKKALKGVVVKKKTQPPPDTPSRERESAGEEQSQAKRRKITDS